MSDKNLSSPFLALPVELVYRIFDNLDELSILISIRGVCTRLNSIIDTYHRYQVKFTFNVQSILINIDFNKTKF
jgi:hypothetical protein